MTEEFSRTHKYVNSEILDNEYRQSNCHEVRERGRKGEASVGCKTLLTLTFCRSVTAEIYTAVSYY